MSRRLVLTPFEETLQTKYGVSYGIVSVPSGWQNVVLSLFEKLQEQSFDFSKVTQVKTKFGEFCFYCNCLEWKKEWDDTIQFYSDIIKNFCMHCGTDAEIIAKNRCQKCREEEMTEMWKKAVQPEI